MTVVKKVVCGVVGGMMLFNLQAATAIAAEAYPVFTEVDSTVASFDGPWVAPFGAYTVDNAATLNGNRVTSITQNSMDACCHGASVLVAVSNGENGDNGPDGTNPVNPTPANSVFNTIGNASSKLEDGNVVRFSAWFRSDPAAPITAEPQVAPILKIEYWTSPFTGNQDTNATQVAPNFGDRLYDQDQQGYALAIPDPPAYVDINNDGTVAHDDPFPPKATAENGRLFGLSTDEWTLASVTHTVNVNDFLGIGASGYGAFTVDNIEAIQGVMFLGEFSTTPVAGPGNLLVDNVLIEVFKDAASVTPINNPDPVLSEVGLQGDYDDSGQVAQGDLDLVLLNWGKTVPPDPVPDGWINEQPSGLIGQTALDGVLLNWGNTAGSGAAVDAAASVPEPATSVLLIFASAGFLMWTRQGRVRCCRCGSLPNI